MSAEHFAAPTAEIISIEGPILTPKQEQTKWLAEALQVVVEQAACMRRYIHQREFTCVLSSASQMLAELRTDMLAPQFYYELYVKVFDEMRHLEQYFEEERDRGRSLENMYEVVQHTGNIVPRLYLLITVGSVYILSGEQPAIEIFRDLVEMCKGVQHPTRGLFMRHFLLTMMKNKLPGDANRVLESSQEGDGGAVEDTAELILQNLKEMNWLWIRIEAKAPTNVVELQSVARRKQKDRKELCVLVGMNIVRLSQLEGVVRQTYESTILPRLLDIILKCREPLAQQYLLEVIVQVFPDEFHLFTLNDLFNTLENVSMGVDVCAILTSLMTRLGNYAVSVREDVAEARNCSEEELLHQMFDIFKTRLDAMVDAGNESNSHETNSHSYRGNSRRYTRNKFTLWSYVKSMMSLINLSLEAEPEIAVKRICIIFSGISERLNGPQKDSVSQIVENMIVHVIDKLGDPSIILTLDNIDVLTQSLPFASRRAVALALCTSSLRSVSYRIATLDAGACFFKLIAPLLRDDPDAQPQRSDATADTVTRAFLEERHLVCRALHLVQCDDAATQMKMLSGVRKLLAQGGPRRAVVTMPTLVSLCLRLALRLAKEPQTERGEGHDNNENSESALCAKAFQAIHSGNGKGILEMLAFEDPTQTFYLYLTSANTADICELPEVAYEHYVSAFQIYEENAADTREQIEMLTCVINSLHELRNMPEESYEPLATKACQYSSKLVRKSDQSRVVLLCAHLFWKNALSEDSHRRVLDCLQRSVKIANHAQATQPLSLFVELLNYMLHYYAGEAPGVTANYISALIRLVRDASSPHEKNNSNATRGHEDSVKESGSDDNDGCGLRQNEDDDHAAARAFYRNTTRYICSRQQVDERWKEIEV